MIPKGKAYCDWMHEKSGNTYTNTPAETDQIQFNDGTINCHIIDKWCDDKVLAFIYKTIPIKMYRQNVVSVTKHSAQP